MHAREVEQVAAFLGRLDHALQRPPDSTGCRPAATAASATLSTRATLEAKQVTATRPLRPLTSSSRLARTVASEPASPSTKTLVLSHTMASAPSSPMRCSIASSVTSPSSGSGSIFQSPVCKIVPNRVRIASALGSRIECVMVISSSSNGGRLNLPPSGISMMRHRVDAARPR